MRYCLIKLCANLWRSIVHLEDLADLSSNPLSLLDLASHHVDVIVVLGKDPSKILEQFIFPNTSPST